MEWLKIVSKKNVNNMIKTFNLLKKCVAIFSLNENVCDCGGSSSTVYSV